MGQETIRSASRRNCVTCQTSFFLRSRSLTPYFLELRTPPSPILLQEDRISLLRYADSCRYIGCYGPIGWDRSIRRLLTRVSKLRREERNIQGDGRRVLIYAPITDANAYHPHSELFVPKSDSARSHRSHCPIRNTNDLNDRQAHNRAECFSSSRSLNSSLSFLYLTNLTVLGKGKWKGSLSRTIRSLTSCCPALNGTTSSGNPGRAAGGH